MGLAVILLFGVFLLTIGAIPAWPHSERWGYWPSGGLALALLGGLARLVLGPW